MRAVAATGPKVLRIGVVQAGRVTEERIIKQRVHVTVGPNEKNLFVVGSGNLPPTFRLFELVGNDYHLNFLDGMSGRVALPTGISDLNVLRGQARRTPQGAYQVRLTEDSRGKVVVGDVTFLFQFVAPPPIQPKPQLPVAVLRGASGIDWNTTMIAALSFLIHFLALGSIYSDWLDPVIDDEVSVANLVDSLKSLPAPPPLEEKPTEEQADKTPEKAPEKTPDKAPTNTAPATKQDTGKVSAAEKASLIEQTERVMLETLAALNTSGPATEGVLSRSEVAMGALDAAAASDKAVGSGSDPLGLSRGGGGTLRPGEQGGGLGGLANTGRSGGTEGSGQTAKVSGPKAAMPGVSSSVAGGSISNAARVIAAMRPAFRACFQKGLDQNPDAQGSVRLAIKVGPGGEVANVQATPSGNLPPGVVDCVTARAKHAQFDPPEGGAAVVQVPVTFVKQ
ncbi:MAG TPA: AgmX/PglI C-terminal domain-containing protein [Polyangiaceae bacterium]|nr:AgmX/PglI C-terminal domain-containing protein [Polyangiaceae bacterium]